MGGSHVTVYQGHGPSGWACSATMGGACGRLNPTRTLVVIGLDASGKSTILSNFTEHDVSAHCVLRLWRPGLRLVFKARGTADTVRGCKRVRRRRDAYSTASACLTCRRRPASSLNIFQLLVWYV